MQIIAGEEFLGGCPVGLAMFDAIGVAGVFVGEVVEIDVYVSADLGHRHVHPVVACHYLQGGNAGTEYLVTLRL